MTEVRFRIDITALDGWWDAAIYDLADHGPFVGRAARTASDELERLLDNVAYYLLTAPLPVRQPPFAG